MKNTINSAVSCMLLYILVISTKFKFINLGFNSLHRLIKLNYSSKNISNNLTTSNPLLCLSLKAVTIFYE
jgi:hypothetical protein